MYIVLGDRQLPVSLVHRSVEVSPFTGRDRQVIELEAEARDEEVHDALLAAIDSEDGVVLSPTNEEEAGRWSASLPSWSSSSASGFTDYKYKLELKEIEEYEVEVLRMDTIEVDLLRFQEDLHSVGNLSFKIVAELDQSAMDQVESYWLAGASFPVERIGVDESPRRMRFGRTYWSKHEGRFKVKTVLVDVGDDDTSGSRIWWPTLDTDLLRDHVAQYAEIVDNLLEILKSNGVLTDEEIADLVSNASESSSKRQFSYFQVPDAELLS